MFRLMRFKIADKSMEPALREGDYVVVSKLNYLFRKPKIKDVAVIKHKGMFMIKRIREIHNDKYFVQGDNRKYNSPIKIERKQIVGKVLLHIRR